MDSQGHESKFKMIKTIDTTTIGAPEKLVVELGFLTGAFPSHPKLHATSTSPAPSSGLSRKRKRRRPGDLLWRDIPSRSRQSTPLVAYAVSLLRSPQDHNVKAFMYFLLQLLLALEKTGIWQKTSNGLSISVEISRERPCAVACTVVVKMQPWPDLPILLVEQAASHIGTGSRTCRLGYVHLFCTTWSHTMMTYLGLPIH